MDDQSKSRNRPVAIGRDDIADSKFLTDFLNLDVKRVRIQLLVCHGRDDCGGQVHEVAGLVVVGVPPSVPLSPLL